MNRIWLGNRIRDARERRHLTQEKLSEIVDISPTHMSVIERGVKGMKLSTFIKIANALDVSADELLCLGTGDAHKVGDEKSIYHTVDRCKNHHHNGWQCKTK